MILFDEIGRGTATYDGMALAEAIIEHIHEKVHAKTLFSTHYHELTVLDERLPRLTNVHVGAVEEEGELVFLHKMLPGPADKSYGIQVAKLAGLPDELLSRATVILEQLEQKEEVILNHSPQIELAEEVQMPIKANQKKKNDMIDEGQLSLFGLLEDSEAEVVKAVRKMNLLTMTPLEALNCISEWQQKLN